MLLWRILLGVSVVLLILFVILLVKKRLLKTKYMYSYMLDRLVRMNKTDEVNSEFVFSPINESAEYIQEYILSKNKKGKYFIGEYSGEYNTISFYIIVFNKKEKAFKVMEVKDNKPKKFTPSISLPKKCKSVNLLIKSVDSKIINPYAIEPVLKRRIVLFSFLVSMSLFMALFAVRGVLVEIFGKVYKDYFMRGWYNYYGLIVMGGVAIIHFILMILILLIKNNYFSKKGEKNNDKF